MPLPGPLLHQQLMDAYTRLQDEISDSRNTIMQSGEEREELDQQRDDALVRLAEHYLPELSPDAIDETWSELRSSITLVLRRKEDHASQTKLRLDDLTNERNESEQRLIDLNTQLDEAIESREKIVGQIETTLRDDAKFAELSDRAAMAEVALERAEANLDEIDQDAARKLPSYDASTLFRYLYDRGYGTSKYSSRGMTRQFDRMLARYIDFSHAKKGYEFLLRTPGHMREIIAEDRDALETVMQELERRRDEIADSHGLVDASKLCSKLEKERDALLKKLEDFLERTKSVQAEWRELEDPRGTYYQEAIGQFREMLSAMSSRDLKRRAEKTRDITDDQIVARLLGVESDIEQMDRSARSRQSAVKDDYVFLEDLGKLIQRFRAAQFDSARSQFVDSFNLDGEIQDARDEVDIDRLWKRLRKAQRWGSWGGSQSSRNRSNPLTHVLINAMGQAAGGTLSEHAKRAGKRRESSWGGSSDGSWDGWSDDSDDDRKKKRRKREYD